MTNLSENENVRNWKDLSEVDRNAALRSNEIFASLQNVFPEADFSEREQLLKKYEINLTCNYCEANIPANFLVGLPSVCPQCKRKSLNAPTAPGAVATWLLQHHKFATTEDRDQNIYAYDEEMGIWSDEKADAIIKYELGIIYGDNLSMQKINNVRVSVQAKTFVPREIFASAVKKIDNKIYINLQNGVLDLASTTLIDHNPNFYFQGQIRVSFDPNAPIPKKFIEFLFNITTPNDENFINLLEAFAYPILPDYPIQRAFAIIGAGNNGKSTFLKAMETFYGEKYVSHLTIQQLSGATNGQPFGLTQLIGKMINIADDLPAKAVKDVGYFKQLTGGSSVEAERKFGNRISFENSAKFYFAANTMPAVSEDTVAFYRRFLFVELVNNITTPKDQKEIIAEIMNESEKSGVLNLILGIVLPKLLYKNDFTCAKDVDAVAQQYQRHSNTAQLFFESLVEFDPESEMQKEEIWVTYQEFCNENTLITVSQKIFWQTFKEVYPQVIEQQIQENGVRKRIIKGIAINSKISINQKENLNSKINIKEYLTQQDTQHTQDFSLLNKNKEVYTYYILIKEKVVYPVHDDNLSNNLSNNSNNLLENQTKQPDSNNILEKSTTPASPETIAQAILRLLRKASQGLYLSGSAGWDLLYNTFPAYPQKEIDKVMQQLIFAGDIYEFKPGQFKSVSSFEAE